MKLTVLGGSAAGPNPGQGCSGYLVESGPTKVVLDLGSGTLPELRKHVDFREIDAIILSHLHLDHVLDVLALRFALAYNPVPPRRPIPLWLPAGGLAFLDRLATALTDSAQADAYFSVFEAREYDPDVELTVGELEFRFHPTVHFVPCWAVRTSNGVDGDLTYTADTAPSANLARFASGSYVVIAEGTERADAPKPIENRGHMTPAEAGALARAAGADVLVLSHLWAENDQFAAVRQARDAFGGAVALATAGLKLDWNAADVGAGGAGVLDSSSALPIPRRATVAAQF